MTDIPAGKSLIPATEASSASLANGEPRARRGFLPMTQLRDYGLGAQILADLGVHKMRFLTNNPKKVIGLEGYGMEIVEVVGIKPPSNPHNERYLETKRQKMGHLL